jgi:hypothetical protein
MYPLKIYTIESKRYTSFEVAELLNCSYDTARKRLNTCKTLKELFEPVIHREYGYRKVYKIEGREFTADVIMSKLNCSHSSAASRLRSCETLKDLLRPIGTSRNDGCFASANKHNAMFLDQHNPIFKLTYGKW